MKKRILFVDDERNILDERATACVRGGISGTCCSLKAAAKLWR
jgi:hypothetical protein